MRLNEDPWGDTVCHAFQRGYHRRFHYLSPQLRKDLAKLRSLIHARRGHALVTGPGGTGKTTLLTRLIEESRVEQAFVIQFRSPPQSFDTLVEALLYQIVPGIKAPTDQELAIRILLNALVRIEARSPVFICIDEAQNAPDEVLLGLLGLSDVDDTGGTVRVPLVLAGTSLLAERLSDLMELPLERFIRMVITLAPLGPTEVQDYIRHQISSDESADKSLFRDDAIERITALSGGVPGEISSLCGLALYVADLEGSKQVTLDTVNQVSRESWITPIARATTDAAPSNLLNFKAAARNDGDKTTGVEAVDVHPSGHAVTDIRSEDKKVADCNIQGVERPTAAEWLPFTPAYGEARSRNNWRWAALSVALLSGSLGYVSWRYLSNDFTGRTEGLTATVMDASLRNQSTQRIQTLMGSGPAIAVPNVLPAERQPEPTPARTGAESATLFVEAPDQGPSERPSAQVVDLSPFDGAPLLKVRFTASETETQPGRAAEPFNASVPNADPTFGLPATSAGESGAGQSWIESRVDPQPIAFDDHVPVISRERLDHKQGLEAAPSSRAFGQRKLVGKLAGPANVRTKPSNQAPLLETLIQGERVTITARIASSNWYQVVEQFGERGYVYAELVSVEQPDALHSVASQDNSFKLIPLVE